MGRRDEDSDDGSGDDEAGGCTTVLVLAILFVPVLLVTAVVAGASWWHERDLRDLAALTVTTARVVDVEQGSKYSRDEYEVAFRPGGGPEVRTEIPVDVASDTEEEVEVAYDPEDPARVRTVEDWEPLYEHTLLVGAAYLVGAPLIVAWAGLRRLWRRVRPR